MKEVEEEKQDDLSFDESGITNARKRKLYFLVALLVSMMLLCLVNLCILLFVYSVLDIGSTGMSSMSFFKDHGAVKWILDADFENVTLHSAAIDGYSNKNVELRGDVQNIELAVKRLLESSVKVTPNGTFIRTQNFRFVNPDVEKTILELNGQSRRPVVGEFSGSSIHSEVIRTPRLVSDHKSNLMISSSRGSVSFTGNEGLYADAKTFDFNAERDIIVNVLDENYGINLNATSGDVQLDPLSLPDSRASSGDDTGAKKYRLCLCTKTGELYRAELKTNRVTCAVATENPC